ncbi:hypothetical protein [Streptomyces griseochromogenes]|uniref:hypothetical protein n=1 Tax=Streptomyces griseochromogenes TaxID=68214 RepID=UPI0037B1A400
MTPAEDLGRARRRGGSRTPESALVTARQALPDFRPRDAEAFYGARREAPERAGVHER